MRRLTVVVLVLMMVPAFPGLAGASADPISGGAVTLRLDKRFRAFLARNQVRLLPAEGAALRGHGFRFPVSGGDFDPVANEGKLELAGEMVFRNARKRVRVRKIVVEASDSPLVAKVGGSQLKVATAHPRSSRRGFGSKLVAKRLLLTPKVATRLNKKLRPRIPFAAGQVVGGLVGVTKPAITSLEPRGRVSLVFDSAFAAKLEQQFVSVNPIFPAEHAGPEFTFPIADRSTLAPDAAAGTVRTGGEIEFLQLGRGQIFWRELWFDLGARALLSESDLEPTPPFAGRLTQGPVLDLGGGSVGADAAARTIVLSGAVLTLPTATATAFNEVFAEGADLFHAGEQAATFSFTARGR